MSGDQAPNQPMAGLIEGRIVHYVPVGQPTGEAEHDAAIVARVLDADKGRVTLVCQGVGGNTGRAIQYVMPCCDYSEDQEPGTWHWIERA